MFVFNFYYSCYSFSTFGDLGFLGFFCCTASKMRTVWQDCQAISSAFLRQLERKTQPVYHRVTMRLQQLKLSQEVHVLLSLLVFANIYEPKHKQAVSAALGAFKRLHSTHSTAHVRVIEKNMLYTCGDIIKSAQSTSACEYGHMRPLVECPSDSALWSYVHSLFKNHTIPSCGDVICPL